MIETFLVLLSLALLVLSFLFFNPISQSCLLSLYAKDQKIELKDRNVGWFGEAIAISKGFDHLYLADHYFNGRFFQLRDLREYKGNQTGENEYKIRIRVDDPGKKFREIKFSSENKYEDWVYYLDKFFT